MRIRTYLRAKCIVKVMEYRVPEILAGSSGSVIDYNYEIRLRKCVLCEIC